MTAKEKFGQPIHVADLLPTLAEIVGIHVLDVDGVSQLPALSACQQLLRPPIVMANLGSEALIDWPWKLVKTVPLPIVPKFLRSDTWYLFNIEKDPEELLDLVESEPQMFEELKNKLLAYPRQTVIELDPSQGFDSFGGEITRAPWAEVSK